MNMNDIIIIIKQTLKSHLRGHMSTQTNNEFLISKHKIIEKKDNQPHKDSNFATLSSRCALIQMNNN
ncbi:hypothetical protein HanIR_Chr08g0350851 [Helianthus annuus]|nr:hypothetical protein HanIR_Chr08g0350851 [Helianthus annuus]